MRSNKHTLWREFLRALTPSYASFICCVCLSIVFVLSQILFDSINYGTIMPAVLDGTWATNYTNYVVSPLLRFLQSTTLQHSSIILLWSVVGLIIYEAFERGINLIRDWRDANRKVSFSRSQDSLRHQAHRNLLVRLAWRLAIGVVAIGLLVALQPLFPHLFSPAKQLVLGVDLGKGIALTLYAIAAWALFGHVITVLLRLYAFRTRLFGDEQMYY